MFEQIEWVRCEDETPKTPGMSMGTKCLVTLSSGVVAIYWYMHTKVRGKTIYRWEDEPCRVAIEQPIDWAKMPTGWKDGNDG